MNRNFLSIIPAVLLLSGCSVGSGDIQWTRLDSTSDRGPATLPIETPDSSAKPPIQISSGGGVMTAPGLSARVAIGTSALNAAGGGIRVQNLTVSREN